MKSFKKANCYAKVYSDVLSKIDLSEENKELIKVTWLNYFVFLDKRAKRDNRLFHFLQITVILIGLLIPVLEQNTYLNTDLFSSGLSVVGLFGLIVAISTGLNRHFRFEERWRHYRRGAEMMKIEAEDFFALAGDYDIFTSNDEGFKAFIESITNYKRQEFDSYITKFRKKSQ